MQVLVDHVHAEPVPPSSRLGQPLPKEVDAFVIDCDDSDGCTAEADAETEIDNCVRMAQCFAEAEP